jgi:hypothetical protein
VRKLPVKVEAQQRLGDMNWCGGNDTDGGEYEQKFISTRCLWYVCIRGLLRMVRMLTIKPKTIYWLETCQTIFNLASHDKSLIDTREASTNNLHQCFW